MNVDTTVNNNNKKGNKKEARLLKRPKGNIIALVELYFSILVNTLSSFL